MLFSLQKRAKAAAYTTSSLNGETFSVQYTVHTIAETHSAALHMNASQTTAALTLTAGLARKVATAHTEYRSLYLGDLQPFRSLLNTCSQFFLRLLAPRNLHKVTECTGGEPTTDYIRTMQEQGAHSTTMQMCVSLGEEGSGTVVEKHVGLGQSNVHL